MKKYALALVSLLVLSSPSWAPEWLSQTQFWQIVESIRKGSGNYRVLWADSAGGSRRLGGYLPTQFLRSDVRDTFVVLKGDTILTLWITSGGRVDSAKYVWHGLGKYFSGDSFLLASRRDTFKTIKGDTVIADGELRAKRFRGDSAATGANDTVLVIHDSTNVPLIDLKNTGTGTEAVAIMILTKIEAIDATSTTRSAIIGRSQQDSYAGIQGINEANGPGLDGTAQGSGPGVKGSSATGIGGVFRQLWGTFIFSDTTTQNSWKGTGVLAVDSILGNARQCKYTFYRSAVQGDTFDFWQWPGTDTIVIYRIDVWTITAPTDFDTLVLIGSDSIRIRTNSTARHTVWGGTAADTTKFRCGVNTAWVCRRVKATGGQDISITIWYYPQPHGPSGEAWKGLALFSPVTGYVLLATALLGAGARMVYNRVKGTRADPKAPAPPTLA